ncbi:hypothetical protein GO730_03700 [Spirosoma sp. HMF3257]|uniref:Uncharacterized protein n=1 Tax=Spirosoma telluris TaxID=2183553 RepID=A0A327NI80_9BACT|nr:hypothetical protein [Spirosoma telluris]RAI73726.1 hypothetical protein HMF3257_03635 [Spirosoma telluris]
MKIKSLLLAFPVLCLACSNPGSDTADPASQMDASPVYAKRPAGVNALSVDFNYDEPCNILGEEYVRSTFNLDEKTELEEAHEHNGCEFEWAGNKVLISFGGSKPYASVYQAEYTFDKMFQKKPAMAAPVVESPASETVNSSEGTSPEAIVSDGEATEHHTTDDNQPKHGGITAATPHLTEPAVSTGKYEAVPNVGDKAVWDANTGMMHVLFNNHIINVTVETKGKAETKKEQAQSLAEVLIEKISANEYIRRL